MKLKSIALLVAVALLSGCAATKEARSVKTSGFLAEYRSLLKPGKKGEEPLLEYRKPGLDIKSYKKILLDPVSVWNDPKSKMSVEDRVDLQKLADSFYASLSEKLSKDYELADKPGPGILRFQIAVTNGEKSNVGLATVSRIVPQLRLVQGAWTFATGKPAFTGEVSVEYKVTDAGTGELLAAGADERVGGIKLFDKNVYTSWGDVKNSFEFWADFTVYRLCELRGDTDCVKPKA